MRSRQYNDIQRLHGTMPLWGVDCWVSLGDLFVDVNILELTSSNRRSELDDLWQDFTKNNSDYRSLDRIGLGNKQQRISGLAVLERDTNLMVVGKPGSGKTTYLQRIVTECNEGKLKANSIPVLVKLREFVDDGREYAYNLEQFLEHQWQLSNTDIELILNQGLALILLDGLDEVAGKAGKQITKEIKRFARNYPQVQVIVTCRTQSQESKFDRFDYVEIADFNQKQVNEFASHWFGAVCTDAEEGKIKAEDFLSQLFREENKPIRELAITPILLSLTCAVFQQTGKFYSKRSKLYEEGLELLLEQWDKSREVERDEIYRDLSVERKLELLGYIAAKKFEQEQYVLFEQVELEEYIAEFLGIGRRESRGVLKAIESQHGLLIERAKEIWSFSHLTFQEYFVASWLAIKSNYENRRIELNNSKWKQVIRILAEISMDNDGVLLFLKKKTDEIIAEESKLQKFLIHLNEKALSVTAPYAQEAIRGFYICIGQYEYSVVENARLSLKIECNFDHKKSPDLNIDFILDMAPVLLANGHVDIFEFEYKNFINPELIEELNKLEKDITKHYKSDLWWNWYHQNCQDWDYRLHELMVKYRNINHNWGFDKREVELIKKYHEYNELLIDCLNSDSETSQSTRKYINNTLLLPISEIEKYKQSNSQDTIKTSIDRHICR